VPHYEFVKPGRHTVSLTTSIHASDSGISMQRQIISRPHFLPLCHGDCTLMIESLELSF